MSRAPTSHTLIRHLPLRHGLDLPTVLKVKLTMSREARMKDNHRFDAILGECAGKCVVHTRRVCLQAR